MTTREHCNWLMSLQVGDKTNKGPVEKVVLPWPHNLDGGWGGIWVAGVAYQHPLAWSGYPGDDSPATGELMPPLDKWAQ